MSTVRQRARAVHQKITGYLPVSKMEEITYDDARSLGKENLPPQLIGTVVDYLTRFMVGMSIQKSFEVSLAGYIRRIKAKGKDTFQEDINNGRFIKDLLIGISPDLDSVSIALACRAAAYDVWARNPIEALSSPEVDTITPNLLTCNNIKIMVDRGVTFLNRYGTVTDTGFTFGPNGYTNTVTSGDGDFLTETSLWDFKALSASPNAKDTLQVLTYWIMGKHSGNPIYDKVETIGLFNPRKNIAYICHTSNISDATISAVEKYVIGYYFEEEKQNSGANKPLQ